MTVVVGYVPSAPGAAALDHAVTEARLHNEALVVVNANRDGHHDHDPRIATDEQLDQLRTDLAGEGITATVRRVVGPDVGEEILAAAVAAEARLIVVGVRGRTPIGKLLLGSVAQRLIMEAPCPVVTVRATV